MQVLCNVVLEEVRLGVAAVLTIIFSFCSRKHECSKEKKSELLIMMVAASMLIMLGF